MSILCFDPSISFLHRSCERSFQKKDNLLEHKPFSDLRIPDLLLRSIKEEIENSSEAMLEITQLTEPNQISMPSTGALIAIAAHYKTKYGIDIECVLDLDLGLFLRTLIEKKDQKPMGVIVYSRGSFHVTPFLFRSGELCSLDTIGFEKARHHSTHIALQRAVHLRSIQVSHAQGVRQADPYSCRVEALCILRNALLHIEDLGEAFQSFESLTEGGTKLPSEWTYIDQIFPVDGVEGLVVRDKKSSTLPSPRTTSAFRETHSDMVTWRCELSFETDDPRSWLETHWQEIRSLEGISEIKSKSGTLTLTWETTKKINTYLTKKGIEFERKFTPQTDPDRQIP
ncbi:MAG: hypothetical protein JSS61_00505 [Verrucomicrobia bacterium]|nr:hypothetical protein [Verrucomicrobiota bacterium]